MTKNNHLDLMPHERAAAEARDRQWAAWDVLNERDARWRAFWDSTVGHFALAVVVLAALALVAGLVALGQFYVAHYLR